MAHRSRREGFTLIELMVVVVVFGLLTALGGVALQDWFGNQRARDAARKVADLFMLARQEAIRTRDNHIVFLDRDAGGGGLQNSEGQPVAGLVVRDRNGDGAPQTNEYVASMPFDDTRSIFWGSQFALPAPIDPAPDDNPAAVYPLADPCCSFTQPGGASARWVVFLPDGTPRGFSVGPFSAGPVGSGNGAAYVSSGERDYAVVLAALGGVRVHAYNEGRNEWRR